MSLTGRELLNRVVRCIIAPMARALVWVALLALVSGAFAWATAFRLRNGPTSRYYSSASRRLLTIAVVAGLGAIVLVLRV